mgnify:CR=1 FL=1
MLTLGHQVGCDPVLWNTSWRICLHNPLSWDPRHPSHFLVEHQPYLLILSNSFLNYFAVLAGWLRVRASPEKIDKAKNEFTEIMLIIASSYSSPQLMMADSNDRKTTERRMTLEKMRKKCNVTFLLSEIHCVLLLCSTLHTLLHCIRLIIIALTCCAKHMSWFQGGRHAI